MLSTFGGSLVNTTSGKFNDVDFESKFEGDIEENSTAIGFRFGDLINPFVDVGASLYAYIHNSEEGTDVLSHTFALSPYLKVRVPMLPGLNGDMVEVYGLATAGLLVDSLTDDGRKSRKANGVRADDINFGWTVGGALGAQVNITRNFGVFAEGGFNRQRLTVGIKETPNAQGVPEQVNFGEAVEDLSGPFAAIGLVFLN